MIVTETSPSRSAASNTSKISPRRRLFSALRFSGRFRVMRRTRGRGSSTRICWYYIGSSCGRGMIPEKCEAVFRKDHARTIERFHTFMPEFRSDVMGAGAARARFSGLATPAEHAAHQLSRTPHPCLAQDIGAIAFNRARAQSERLRDFLGALAERDSFQHLPLAAGEV